ncbi:MAG: M36 family metallopeptidase [Proteobacteria bacterium]|nr:M36 family metallopeptidase [Pseudomonadota bacterium]
MRLRHLAGLVLSLSVSVVYADDRSAGGPAAEPGNNSAAHFLSERPGDFHAYHSARAVSRVESLARPMQNRLPGRIAALDDKRRVPSLVWADQRRTPGTPHTSPRDAAAFYLELFAPMYRLSTDALSTIYVRRVHDTGHGAIAVFFGQRIDGVDVLHGEMAFLMRRDGSLVAITGNLHDAAVPGPRRFDRSAEEALTRALSDLYGESPGPGDGAEASWSVRATGVEKAGYRYYELFARGAMARQQIVATEPARVKRVLFALPDRLVPAYYIEIAAGKSSAVDGDAYGYVVAASDGTVLLRQNQMHRESFEYRVWAEPTGVNRPLDGPQEDFSPHPTGLPGGPEPLFVAPAVIAMEGFNTNPSGLSDPWLPAGATETRGNNVDAYADHVDPDHFSPGDVRADLSGPLAFDWHYDPLVEPKENDSQSKAAITQLFYTTNWLHDYWYDSGFDEAAGNAQADNYGRGGIDGDPLLAEAQDGGSRNNANMRVPIDGSSPTMQMYLWDGLELARSVDALDRRFPPGPALFGPREFDVTAQLVLVDDGTDTVSDACEDIGNDVNGRIALIDRGTCKFAFKAKNAENKGALAVLIANHIAGDEAPVMGNTVPPTAVNIPTFSLTLKQGQALKDGLAGGPVTVRVVRDFDVDRDAAIDNTIVAHEWGHYLHRRLTTCTTKQCKGQSEGWADFIALHMMIREGDNLDGAFPIAGYSGAVIGDSSYYGIRRAPYSVDPTINALTLRHIADGEGLPDYPFRPNALANSEVHNAGEIFASILLEGYIAMLKASRSPSPPYTFVEAQRRMANYVVLGMQLAPVDATYTEQLDAVLAAALATDSSDHALLAGAFARRGAGTCARSPSRLSMDFVGVSEDFAVRGAMEVTSVALTDQGNARGAVSCDIDGVLDAGEIGSVHVEVTNPSAAALTSETVITVASDSLIAAFPGGQEAAVPPIAALATASATVPVALSSTLSAVDTVEMVVTLSNQETCETTVASVTTHPVNYDTEPSAGDAVDHPQVSWTESSATALRGVWSRVVDPLDPVNFVWYGVNSAIRTDTALTSPRLEVSSTADFVLSFDHRHRFETDLGGARFFDGGVIEISDDGGQSWRDIRDHADPGYGGVIDNGSDNPLRSRPAFVGKNPSHPISDQVSVNLGRAFAGTDVLVRFRLATDRSTGAHGWEIDNIAFAGLTNTPFTALSADAAPCETGLPIPDAGADRSVVGGELVTLDATASRDPDGDPLTFQWGQITGPEIELSNSDRAVATFTAPEVERETVLRFAITAHDGVGAARDGVDITVLGPADSEPDGGMGGCCQASPSSPAHTALWVLLLAWVLGRKPGGRCRGAAIGIRIQPRQSAALFRLRRCGAAPRKA